MSCGIEVVGKIYVIPLLVCGSIEYYTPPFFSPPSWPCLWLWNDRCNVYILYIYLRLAGFPGSVGRFGCGGVIHWGWLFVVGSSACLLGELRCCLPLASDSPLAHQRCWCPPCARREVRVTAWLACWAEVRCFLEERLKGARRVYPRSGLRERGKTAEGGGWGSELGFFHISSELSTILVSYPHSYPHF